MLAHELVIAPLLGIVSCEPGFQIGGRLEIEECFGQIIRNISGDPLPSGEGGNPPNTGGFGVPERASYSVSSPSAGVTPAFQEISVKIILTDLPVLPVFAEWRGMKATLRLKLHTDPATKAALHETLRQSTACFNAVCRHGWDHKERNGTRLHQSTYSCLRQLYDTLPSQLVISARMKAAEALKSVSELHKRGKKISCPQSELCAIRYDARSYWVKLEEGIASLATVCGRANVSFRLPDCYKPYLTWDTCSADLCWNQGKKCFYLHVVLKTEAPPLAPNGNVVGCDLGVKRVAVTSTPQFFSSARMHTRVRQYEHLRSSLQAKGTRSAKRHLQKVARRWTRFQACHNHLIANAILAPMNTGDTLAIEDLTDIREGCKHRKKQRGRFHRWSFAQLGAFLAYKAERKGILVVTVDSQYSSQTCSKCGHCEKKNRKGQSRFVCQSCGYTANADYNAAQNLRQRGIAFLARRHTKDEG